MPDEKEVDGFSDVKQQGNQEHGQPHEEIPGPPDPGVPRGAEEPLDPEEYAKEQKEAREE